MNFIVIGCGRVGADLAYRLFKNGHRVVVVDNNQQAFNRLHPEFRGRTVEGEALTAEVLERAEIEKADGIVAATNSDTLNAVIGHTAHVHYNVPHVVVRNYDPDLRPMLEAFGLQIVSSTSWGAQRLEELLLDPAFRAVFSAGNGEVEIYELLIPPAWDGRTLGELLSASGDCLPVALTRAGRAVIPGPEMRLKSGDLLNVSATLDGIRSLRARLAAAPEV